MTVHELVKVIPSIFKISFWMRKDIDIYMGTKCSPDDKYPSEDIPNRKVVEIKITSLDSVDVVYAKEETI